MVQVDPFDMWILGLIPDLSVRYAKGPHVQYFDLAQMRLAFEAGMKTNPPQTVTVSASAYPAPSTMRRILSEQRKKRARKRRRK